MFFPRPDHYEEWGPQSREIFDRIAGRPHWLTFEKIAQESGVKSNTLRTFMRGKIKDLRATDAHKVKEYFDALEISQK